MGRNRKRTDRRRPKTSKPRIRFPTLTRLYVDARTRAMNEYPSILGIHECTPSVYRLQPDELFRRFGYEDHQQLFWGIDKEDYIQHARSKGNFAGHVTILSDGRQARPVVFVMRPPNMPKIDHEHGWMMGVLFHELGHVDDISRGVHLRMDACVDITAAEVHAHRYACERFISESQYVSEYIAEMAPDLPVNKRTEWCECVVSLYRATMAFYIRDILAGHTELPEGSVREAALRVLESDEMVKFRQFAGNAVDDEERTTRLLTPT